MSPTPVALLITMFLCFSIFLGAIIGSFLNCLIYRLPRHLSLLTPKRSFCPACNHSLSWFENLPIISYLLLKGRCRSCQSPIPIRYLLVEITTALLFGLCYSLLGFSMAGVAWLFVALLVVATWIDLEHLIIPNEITLGGIALGLSCSFFLPEMMGVSSRWTAVTYSLASTFIAYLLLWFILELGKKIFGKKRLRWKAPQDLALFKKDHLFFLRLGEEELLLSDLFSRPSDRILVTARTLDVTHQKYGALTLTLSLEQVVIPDHTWKLEEAVPLQASITEITLPQEAMGFGDVKFLACIASFLGIKGMLFSLFGGSILGALTGSILLIATRGRQGRTLPFGPYLALAALLWLLWGKTLLGKFSS